MSHSQQEQQSTTHMNSSNISYSYQINMSSCERNLFDTVIIHTALSHHQQQKNNNIRIEENTTYSIILTKSTKVAREIKHVIAHTVQYYYHILTSPNKNIHTF